MTGPIKSTKYSNSPRMDLNVHSWAWEDISEERDNSKEIIFDDTNRTILFHPTYSSGTIVVRGDTPFVFGNEYYWEIEILTPLYGTDVMVGVGTNKVSMTDNKYTFCSLLGLDQESWGYSYNGTIQHNGEWHSYGPGFNNSSTIGMHLNTWDGTLSYFVDGKPLGVAFYLKGSVLYPMVCSTAACSALRLIYSYTCPSSLQLLSLRALSTKKDMVNLVSSIPGLKGLAEKTSLAYRNNEKTENPKVQEIYREKHKNQCRPNFIIVNDDEDEDILTRSQRKRKRKYVFNVPRVSSTSNVGTNTYENVGGVNTYENVGGPITYEKVGRPITYEKVGRPITYEKVGGVERGCDGCGASTRPAFSIEQNTCSTRQPSVPPALSKNHLCPFCDLIF